MPSDRKKLHLISILVPALLVLAFAFGDGSKIYAAIFLPIATIATSYLIKHRTAPSIYKGQVLLLMTVIAPLYLMLYYLTGLYFGLGETAEYTPLSILTEAVPIAVSILSVEHIRNILTCQKVGGACASALITSVILDAVLLFNLEIRSLEQLMSLMGLLVPSVCSNLLYNYLSKRYGKKPVIAYRLITILYIYFIPYLPKMNDVLNVVIKTTVPVLIYLFIYALYEKKTKIAKKRRCMLPCILLSCLSVFLLCVIGMVSCQFRYGALVIGSDSMTGELDVGDVAVYEQYNGEEIKVSDIIVFKRGSSRIIHRVIKKENINGENRYTTKGDFNEDADHGYRSDSDIIGIVKIKIPYAGNATVWLKNIFEAKQQEGE